MDSNRRRTLRMLLLMLVTFSSSLAMMIRPNVAKGSTKQAPPSPALTKDKTASIVSPRIIWQPRGLELSKQECDLLAHPASAGLILFAHNYADPIQLKSMIVQAKTISPQAIISIDHEGGRVQRLRDSFTIMPPAALIGKLYQQDPSAGIAMAELSGRLAGAELHELGINVNYAPVLDIDHQANRAIGDRAWGKTTDQIIVLANAYIRGLQLSGVHAAGKHYPGHGGVTEDSHRQLPIDRRPADAIKQDMQPFIELADQLSAIMTAHVTYQAMDSMPATFSHFWLQQQLRNNINYQGVIISDDLMMRPLASLYSDIESRLAQVFNAGCDLALVTGGVKTVERAMAFVEKENLPPAPISRLQPLTPVQDGFDIQAARHKLKNFYDPS